MNPLDKIHALDEIEKDIILCMQSAGKRYYVHLCMCLHSTIISNT